ncbi:hypothetical protein PHYSODRAFT_339764 [Phytophthora sojae]|uniref:Uncharacterized protein n=1 Tax=Phytophthora sojae (strain P6497) TaxID=1094619 RepID=G5A7I6_PHYSP|nr:hypothetical protein PHYSODRAFT_339764 [Phytophthora sojae]EGZ07865.1 hypothetical protein PHYSODRAFT_339764 [Phytophthora sojae]|eukprot:XP_009536037.1 hypothetical protein PHYSODRAFT_339764 [Phytophthora sojae]
MTATFFAAGQTVDLNAVGAYLNYVVGAFMIVLGTWTPVNVRKKYLQKVKELDELPTSPSVMKSPDYRSPVTRSPASSFHLFIQSNGNHDHTHHVNRLSVVESVDLEPGKPDKTRTKCCSNLSFENPWVQKITALAVGVIHGIAGPGGILGVLPAVVLNNWLKSTAYLGSFCIASIVTMGGFAALYGEVTGRLGGSSLAMDLRVGLVSASFSFAVGIAWIVFQATGLMSGIFGE